MNYFNNLWYYLLQENVHLFSDEALTTVSYYTGKVVSNKNRTHYVNLFNLDNRSSDDLCKLINELYDKKDQVILPKFLVRDAPTIFFNESEGHGPNEFFYALHKLIEICHLTGSVTYKNGSVNIGIMYEEFCNEQQVIPKMMVDYSGNIGWSNPKNAHYSLPDHIPFHLLKVEDQKLYSSFNWNAWDHRFGLIALLHYYNLLNDGYVTSPGKTKYAYSDEDYKVLYDCSIWYLKSLDVYDSVIESLSSLKDNYPLKIDDRSQYVDTDTPLVDHFLKMPLYQARINSLFEIVAETRFTKEHWFSEKTYWPLKLGKPFLLINGSGSLKSLKMLGYKTFNDYIDESYDEQTSTPHKIQQVVLEMTRLKEFRDKNPIGFYEMYAKLEEIGKHNSEVFKKGHAYL